MAQKQKSKSKSDVTHQNVHCGIGQRV